MVLLGGRFQVRVSGWSSWEETGEAVAGWGDTITFGATKWARDQLGDENVDTCSGAYQSGSTRLLTGSTGKVEGKCSYSAYGTTTCEDSATTHSATTGSSPVRKRG
jgi:hypothetical protein